MSAGEGRPMSAGEGTDTLERLVGLLREQGGMLATLVASGPASEQGRRGPADLVASDPSASREERAGASRPAASDPHASGQSQRGPAQLAARGPRTARAAEEYELLVEAIYEGYLLHYGAGRVIAAPEDDLGLLAGDRLYALGLARLVALGDAEAVKELADTITLSSLAQAAGEPRLAAAVWQAGARAVGWGSSGAHEQAKQLVYSGAPEAFEAMRTSADGHPASP